MSQTDIAGRIIKILINESQEAGYYSVKFNVTDLYAGIYFYT